MIKSVMTMSALRQSVSWLLLCASLALATKRHNNKYLYQTERRARVTRMSVLDFYKYETNGDGINIKWGHGVNSWQALIHHLQDPYNNKSYLLEGDVQMSSSSPRVPVMNQKASLGGALHKRQALTFKQWLNQTSGTKKAIKINLKSNAVVKPALNYLYAAKTRLESPVIIHANIWKGPADSPAPLAARRFVEESSARFPDATLSVGWTQPQDDQYFQLNSARYSWRDVFDMLEDTYRVTQPVMFSVRASMAQYSCPQLLWLLGIRSTFSMHLWSDDHDAIANWAALVKLRKYADPKQIIYDLRDADRDRLMDENNSWAHLVQLEPTEWQPYKWRVVEFMNPTRMLSTVITGGTGPAFLGYGTAFLLSEHQPVGAGYPQTVSGQLQFSAKPQFHQVNHARRSGLSLLLLPSINDVPSPYIYNGIQVFIGYDGFISIENRDYDVQRRRVQQPVVQQSPTSIVSFFTGGSDPPVVPLVPKISSQITAHGCYAFHVVDRATIVSLVIRRVSCLETSDDAIGRQPPPPDVQPPTTLSLNVPAQSRQRYVILQKQGDETLDFWIYNLAHRSASDLGASTGAARGLHGGNSHCAVVLGVVLLLLLRIRYCCL